MPIRRDRGRVGRPLIPAARRLQPAQRDWMARAFGAQNLEEADTQGVAYQPRGDMGRWCVAQRLAPQYLVGYAEFGTYSDFRVFAGLRAENQAHHWGRPVDLRTLQAKRRLLELFCPASPEWRSQVLDQGSRLVESAVGTLARTPPGR